MAAAAKAKAKQAQAIAKGKAKAISTANAAANASVVPVIDSRPKPSVTLPWADYASSSQSLSSTGGGGGSGGIIRISYDQALFEEGVREVITDPKPRPEIEKEIEGGEGEKEAGEKAGEGEGEKKKVVLEKDDVALLMKEMDYTTKEAEDLLRSTSGDLGKALLECTKPVVVGVGGVKK